MVAVAVICAEDDERARWLAGPARLSMARLRTGRPGRFPSPEEAAAHQYAAEEQAVVKTIGGRGRRSAARRRSRPAWTTSPPAPAPTS